MLFSDVSSITPTSALAALAWFLLFTTALYFTREPAHRVIASLSRVLRSHPGLRRAVYGARQLQGLPILWVDEEGFSPVPFRRVDHL